MTRLEFTQARYPDNESEVIRVFAYNENTRTLNVVLRDNEVYSYPSVPQSVLDEFAKSVSAGAYYNTHFKRTCGPGTHLGSYTDIDWKFVGKDVNAEETQAAVGTPKGLSYAEGAVVTNRNEEPRVTLGAPAATAVATGNATGNHLVFTPNTNGITTTGTLAVKPFRAHVVTFTIEGIEGEREFSASVMDVSQAVNDLQEYSRQLGLTVKVKKVVVYFE